MRSGARLWFAMTALVVAVAMVIQVRAVAQLDTGFFDSDLKRIVDVGDHGYLPVFVNIVLITGLFLGLAAGARVLDGRLPGVAAGADRIGRLLIRYGPIHG
jgi:hypothetical protein